MSSKNHVATHPDLIQKSARRIADSYSHLPPEEARGRIRQEIASRLGYPFLPEAIPLRFEKEEGKVAIHGMLFWPGKKEDIKF